MIFKSLKGYNLNIMDLADISKKLGREKIEKLLPIENKRFFSKRILIKNYIPRSRAKQKRNINYQASC